MLENNQVRRSFSSVLFMPYNKSFIDQASSVKMAGYWPSSLFAFLWTSTSSRSTKTTKRELGQCPAILTLRLINNIYILPKSYTEANVCRSQLNNLLEAKKIVKKKNNKHNMHRPLTELKTNTRLQDIKYLENVHRANKYVVPSQSVQRVTL